MQTNHELEHSKRFDQRSDGGCVSRLRAGGMVLRGCGGFLVKPGAVAVEGLAIAALSSLVPFLLVVLVAFAFGTGLGSFPLPAASAQDVSFPQSPLRSVAGPPLTLPGVADAAGASAGGESAGAAAPLVTEVRIVGAKGVPREKFLPAIKTRAGRPFNPDLIEEDVRRLHRTGLFLDVKTYTPEVAGGRLVVFEVLPRPLLHYVTYAGNRAFDANRLAKETGLATGDPLDNWQVEEAQRRILELYRSKGYPDASVMILEGNKPEDQGAVFLINEGRRQRIGWTDFLGNTIASDARLRTQVQTKPGWLWFLGGLFNRETLDADVERLTAYYRGLGFFRARVGRHVEVHSDPFDSNREWVTVTFVIDEGPRYRVRNIAFFGNEKLPREKLEKDLELKAGDYFDQNKLQLDVAKLQDQYGAIGHVFADVEVDPRFLEEPGMLDLVYRIDEGRKYQVGRINVKIQGEFPHTRLTTVLDRMSLAPTDIVDTRQLRDSERRLRASQIFEVDPTRGVLPKIVFSPPEVTDPDTGRPRQRPVLAEKGNSPPRTDPAPGPRPPTLVPNDGVIPAGGEETPSTAEPTIYRGQYGPAAGTSLPSPPPWWRRVIPNRKPAEDTATAEGAVYTQQPGLEANAAVQPAVYTSPGVAWSPQRPEVVPTAGTDAIPADPSGIANPTGANAVDRSGGAFATPSGGAVAPAGGVAAGGTSAAAEPILFPDRPPPGEWDGYWDTGEPSPEPPLELPLEPIVTETRTGRLLFSVGVNSDAGLLGTVLVEEQNFDIARLPRSWREIADGVAWRGAGQRFRLEAVPGTEVQRYSVSFSDPYFLNRNVSLSVSGYYYRRNFREWNEERLGGRIGFGYQFTPDLSGTIAYRGADIKISDPIITPFGTPQDLLDAVGTSILHGFEVALTHDTRDNSFLPTEGHLFQVSFEQVVGTYDYPRAELDLRKYFMLSQRPDGSGRHVLGLSTRFSATGSDTPIYDHYFAGGYSSLRGFDFRGASPHEMGISVGGHMMLLASAEYMFPITADDLIRGVIFCDTGTVERTADSWDQNYRVAPGFGLRIVIPAMGPAPIALDFAFPVSKEPTDDEQVFSFFIGFLR